MEEVGAAKAVVRSFADSLGEDLVAVAHWSHSLEDRGPIPVRFRLESNLAARRTRHEFQA